MNTKVILKVDTLKNLVEWLGYKAQGLSCNAQGHRPSNARALYIFANKPDTLLDNDAMISYGKFESDSEAEQYFNSFENTKFIIESELVEETTWTHNKGMETEYKTVSQAWKITVTPSMNNTEDAFNMYLAEPYNPA